VLVLNGVAFYGTWTSIAQCLNIAFTLTYEADVDIDTSCLVVLSILTANLVLYWICDFYALRTYLVYTYSPYAVLLFALSAISTNPDEPTDDFPIALQGGTRTFIYVLIGLSAFTAVLKIVNGILFAMNSSTKKNRTEVAALKENAGVDAQYNMMTEEL